MKEKYTIPGCYKCRDIPISGKLFTVIFTGICTRAVVDSSCIFTVFVRLRDIFFKHCV